MSDNSLYFETLVVEVRPRLQSVNVVISLKQKLDNIKIHLNEDSFKLVVADASTTVSCKNLKIVKDSLNSLNITNSSVSFRFGTVNDVDDWGSVKLELLKIANEKRKDNESEAIFVDSTTSYKIQCNNCMNNLMEDVKFSRILPLPSDNAEPSDWFCHTNINYNLNPRKNDFFYGNCYCHLQNNLKSIKFENDVLICNGCLSYLGISKNAETCKLWFNTVRFVSDTNVIHNTEPLKDMFISLKEVLSTTFYNTVKILLSCRKTLNKQFDYIFLWILEKELTVQIWDPTVNNCRVAKVLFKNECEGNEKVKIWKNDVNIISLDISEQMFVEILKHLFKYNKIFPNEFSESNGFYISYLMLYDTDT